ncbi:hypothetical protein Tco_1123553 [Tanacetum coccineum]|uniref:Uncharacterized protein n=1 Tax=Tanacetum coccineum TaxID=301880 RepID=A0ABQ5J6F8_9ASTR
MVAAAAADSAEQAAAVVAAAEKLAAAACVFIIFSDDVSSVVEDEKVVVNKKSKGCATVEEMGDQFRGGGFFDVRDLIRRAARVRSLPPEEFCRQNYVIAKASEAGFGNEMYKILTAAALSVMLNRSLIIGQTRHIGSISILAVFRWGKYPFGEYISYADTAFALSEVKHLWRQNGCLTTYGKHLVIRIDDFQRPRKTNVLCSNWREWKEPIIWFQNTTDAVAAQFFLKNVHVEMRKAASDLFGEPQNHHRPNVFGELMRILVSPTEKVKQAVDSVLSGGSDPDIVLHMRMLMNRSVRALQAALDCTKKVLQNTQSGLRLRLVLVSDTPSLVEDVKSSFDNFAEVVHFDYESYEGELSGQNGLRSMRLVSYTGRHPDVLDNLVLADRSIGRCKFRCFFVGICVTENFGGNSSFTFFSSFQSTLVSEGLSNQVGWGHVWNRFAGPLSCGNQTSQCAYTPLLSPAWWDDMWQSPTRRDINRMEAYGVRLSGLGTVDEDELLSYCSSRKEVRKFVTLV